MESKAKQKARAGHPGGPASAPKLASALKETRLAGLTHGENTEHVNFPAPSALAEAAKRTAGSTNERAAVAPAMPAQPDPVAAFFRRTDGRLGQNHALDC